MSFLLSDAPAYESSFTACDTFLYRLFLRTTKIHTSKTIRITASMTPMAIPAFAPRDRPDDGEFGLTGALVEPLLEVCDGDGIVLRVPGRVIPLVVAAFRFEARPSTRDGNAPGSAAVAVGNALKMDEKTPLAAADTVATGRSSSQSAVPTANSLRMIVYAARKFVDATSCSESGSSSKTSDILH